MIFQELMTSLDPVMRIGPQIEAAILAHEPTMRAASASASASPAR